MNHQEKKKERLSKFPVDGTVGKIIDEIRDSDFPGCYYAKYSHPVLDQLNEGREQGKGYRISATNAARKQSGEIIKSLSGVKWGWSSPSGFEFDSESPEEALSELLWTIDFFAEKKTRGKHARGFRLQL